MKNKRRIRFLVALILLAVILVSASPVLAHANLVRSEPAANSASPVPPARVRLWFSEEIEMRFTMVSVLNTSGIPVDKGDSHHLIDDAKAMEISLPELPRGLYTVVWHALSAVDGHTTEGSFVFTIGDTPLSESSPRQIIAQVDAALSVRELAPVQQIVIRWLNLLLLVLLAGSIAFPILILRPTIRNIDSLYIAWQMWTRRWILFVRVMLVLYAVALLFFLAMQAINAGGSLGAAATVLTSTRFGWVWLLRVALLIALGILFFRAKNNVSSNHVLWLGALLVIAQSLISHNAAVDDPPAIPLLTDIVHLLATSIWVGGLGQLLFTVPAFLQTLNATQRVKQLAALIARFSLIAFISVGAIIATGAVATLVQVGSFEAFFDTLYGASLFIKIVLLVPLLVLAAFNLIVMRPVFANAVAQHVERIIAQFNLAVALEILIAIAILFIVGILTSITPARVAYDPSPQLWLDSHRVDDLNITLSIAPGKIGANDFDVYLRDTAGQPVNNATAVRLLGDMREMTMGVQELTTHPQGNGHYTLHADLLSMSGTWDIEVLVRRPRHDDARTMFSIATFNQTPPPSASTLVLALEQTPIQTGLALTLFGFVMGMASVFFLRRRNSRRASLIGAIVVAGIGTFVVTQTPIPTSSSPPVIIPSAPEFARTMRIPFRVDANRIASGRQTFLQNCATCHGESGKGDGPAAAKLNPPPIDLTVHVHQHTDGELYWWVTNGITGTAMPAWSSSLNDDQRWEVIAYLRRAFSGDATPTPIP